MQSWKYSRSPLRGAGSGKRPGELVNQRLGLACHLLPAELQEAVAGAGKDFQPLVVLAGGAEQLTEIEANDADAVEAAQLQDYLVRFDEVF